MPLRRYRHLCSLITALLFAFSIVGNGFMLGDMMLGDMAAKMSMAAGIEMPAQDSSMDCDKSATCDHDRGMPMACFAHCASTVAVLSDTIRLPVIALTRTVVATAVSIPAGHQGPPDPYPPKALAVI
jgi:hypothetical protein